MGPCQGQSWKWPAVKAACSDSRPCLAGQYDLRWWHPNKTQHSRWIPKRVTSSWKVLAIRFVDLGELKVRRAALRSAWPNAMILRASVFYRARRRPSRLRRRDAPINEPSANGWGDIPSCPISAMAIQWQRYPTTLLQGECRASQGFPGGGYCEENIKKSPSSFIPTFEGYIAQPTPAQMQQL